MKAHAELWNCGIAEQDENEWSYMSTTNNDDYYAMQDYHQSPAKTATLSYESVEVRGMYCLFNALYFGGKLKV